MSASCSLVQVSAWLTAVQLFTIGNGRGCSFYITNSRHSTSHSLIVLNELSTPLAVVKSPAAPGPNTLPHLLHARYRRWERRYRSYPTVSLLALHAGDGVDRCGLMATGSESKKDGPSKALMQSTSLHGPLPLNVLPFHNIPSVMSSISRMLQPASVSLWWLGPTSAEES